MHPQKVFHSLPLFLFIATVSAQTPQAPTALTVVSATSKQVQLSWQPAPGANGYAVQRKSLNGTYATFANVTAASATDNTIDPYATYVYRVIATADSAQSDGSNEVKVGPPPERFSVASLAPPHSHDLHPDYGRGLRMILDSNGDPALSFLWVDPNVDGDNTDSQLYFMSWNRAQYQWNAPVQIATVGDIDAHTLVPISLARDASNNVLGIAYLVAADSGYRIDLATSTDGGAGWKPQTVATSADQLQEPSLGMAKGNVHLAFYHDTVGLQYMSGSETAAPATWTTQNIAPPPGYTDVLRAHSLAVDSAGNPGVAFIAVSDSDTAESFWRPGASAIVAASNNGKQTDDPDVQLSFAGTKPRIAYAGGRDDNYFADYDHLIWAMKALDDGASWAPAVNVPSDGNRSLEGPIWISSGSNGQAAIVSTDNGGNQDNVKCGEPKISRSSDVISWATCGAASLDGPSIGSEFAVVQFGGNDKLWVSFQIGDDASDLPAGIVIWREPLN